MYKLVIFVVAVLCVGATVLIVLTRPHPIATPQSSQTPKEPQQVAPLNSVNVTPGASTTAEGTPVKGATSAPREPRVVLLDTKMSETDRNNAAVALQKARDPKLVQDLLRMLSDEKESIKWRNYCVQNLRSCYEDNPDPLVLQAVLNAMNNPIPEISSCAIWSAARIATEAGTANTITQKQMEEIRQLALSSLRKMDGHFLLRTAGVQSSARLQLREALPDIRALASSDSTKPTSLRIAAVAALGDLKDTESIPLLEKLSKEATGQLQSAADLALKRIHAEKDAAPQQ